MNLLVLVQNYPSEFDPHSLKYVHTRNKYYSDLGINVLVLAFKATKEYVFENISVTNFKLFNRKYDIKSFDAIVSHAPNLRNHLKFVVLRKYFNTNLLTGKIKLIFVSEWMKNEFQNNVQIKTNLLENNSAII